MKKIFYLIKRPFLVIFSGVSTYLLVTNFSLNISFAISSILFLLGFFTWSFGLIELGKNFSIFPKPRILIKTGIYKKVRHPIYLGHIIISFSWIVITQNLFFVIFWIILTLILAIRIGMEEGLLEKKFGNEYRTYKKKTLSRTFFTSSPEEVFSLNFSHRWAIGFPQLKQRIGIIMIFIL